MNSVRGEIGGLRTELDLHAPSSREVVRDGTLTRKEVGSGKGGRGRGENEREGKRNEGGKVGSWLKGVRARAGF